MKTIKDLDDPAHVYMEDLQVVPVDDLKKAAKEHVDELYKNISNSMNEMLTNPSIIQWIENFFDLEDE